MVKLSGGNALESAIRDAIQRRFEELVEEEVQAGVQRVRERLHRAVAEVGLSAAQYYRMDCDERGIVITVKEAQ